MHEDTVLELGALTAPLFIGERHFGSECQKMDLDEGLQTNADLLSEMY